MRGVGRSGPSASGDLEAESAGAQVEHRAGGAVGAYLTANGRSGPAPAGRGVRYKGVDCRWRIAGAWTGRTVARERYRRGGGGIGDPRGAADHRLLIDESAGCSARAPWAGRAAVLERHIRRARQRRRACQQQARTDDRQRNDSPQHGSRLARGSECPMTSYIGCHWDSPGTREFRDPAHLRASY